MRSPKEEAMNDIPFTPREVRVLRGLLERAAREEGEDIMGLVMKHTNLLREDDEGIVNLSNKLDAGEPGTLDNEAYRDPLWMVAFLIAGDEYPVDNGARYRAAHTLVAMHKIGRIDLTNAEEAKRRFSAALEHM